MAGCGQGLQEARHPGSSTEAPAHRSPAGVRPRDTGTGGLHPTVWPQAPDLRAALAGVLASVLAGSRGCRAELEAWGPHEHEPLHPLPLGDRSQTHPHSRGRTPVPSILWRGGACGDACRPLGLHRAPQGDNTPGPYVQEPGQSGQARPPGSPWASSRGCSQAEAGELCRASPRRPGYPPEASSQDLSTSGQLVTRSPRQPEARFTGTHWGKRPVYRRVCRCHGEHGDQCLLLHPVCPGYTG